MKNVIEMSISYEDDMYIASGVNVPVVTNGKTFEELQDNIREAIELYFEGEDPEELGFSPASSIISSFTLTSDFHGNKA